MSPSRTMKRCFNGLLLAVAVSFSLFTQAEVPFDYFANSWNVIGLKDYARGTRITPENSLLLGAGNGKGTVTLQIRFGKNLELLKREQTKTLQDGWLPVVLLTAQDGPVRYDFRMWATPLPSVKDWEKAFGWPTEGENFLNWIEVRVTNTGSSAVEAKLRFEPGAAPDRPLPSWPPTEDFSWTLAPSGSTDCIVRIPWEPVEGSGDFSSEDADLWLQRTIEYWRSLVEGVTSIRVPCAKASQAYLTAHVCQFIASDHGELHGGEGFYDEFYIRDGGYQVMELEEAGLLQAARKAMDAYLENQRPDGRFESQKDQFDANGQALWVLWQFHKITGDREWLERVYPQMRRAVDWLMQERRKSPPASQFAGVLPNTLADGEFLWNGNYHIVGYDFWNLRGLLCTADAARILGKTEEAESLFREAGLYRAAIDAAWKRTGHPFFPPSWEKAGTHWGNTETLWPTEIFDRNDPRVTALLEEVRERHGGGFAEGTIRWLGGDFLKSPSPENEAIHPYMSAYTTMASLVRGEHEKVIEEFYWYLLHSSASHAFPEGIFFNRRFAWGNTIPHVTGASNYALMLRHMLIHERGDELHLLSAIPDWWISEGEEIVVERAPTHFGEVSLRVKGTVNGVEIEFDPPRREPPARILLHLPNSRPLLKPLVGVDVVPRSEQQKRWDFPTVVKEYEELGIPLSRD